jgi:hypothetical protein
VKFAYADPPYPGMAKKLYNCDEVNHINLIHKLVETYDGWALSTKSNSLKDLLPLCPKKTRVAAWVKPFAFMRPNIWPCYAWEPIIFFKPKRLIRRDIKTPHDWILCNPYGVSKREREKGNQIKGQKPDPFSFWLFSILDMRPGDIFDDLFPGSKRVSKAWEKFIINYARPISKLSCYSDEKDI